MKRYRLLILAGLLSLGTGCVSLNIPLGDSDAGAAPVTDLEQADADTGSTDSAAPVSRNKATNSLVAQASRMRAAGNLESAAASLERALRIEPRNGWLWHRLAQIRLDQGRNDLAINLARKSSSLAAGDQELVRANRELIRRASHGRG